MTQLPLLVTQLIDWYIWKAKMCTIRDEYWNRISYHSQLFVTGKQVETDTFYLYEDEENEHVQMRIQYRTWDEARMEITQHFICRDVHTKVALLPSKYYYSSGSSNPSGFLSETLITNKKHYWLPDFFMLV